MHGLRTDLINHTDTGGDLPALLFVHDVLMDHTVWREQVDYFSRHYRVVCIDLRGFGKSVATDPRVSCEQHVADISRLIATLDLRHVTLVGWSMGGAVAQVFAATRRREIESLVLVGSSPQLVASDRFPHAMAEEEALLILELLRHDLLHGCYLFGGMIAPESRDIAASLAMASSLTDQRVALAAFEDAFRRSHLDVLPLITVPTAVICGENDLICPVAASDFLAAKIPGSTGAAILIEEAGHAPFLTRPAVFNAVLENVLRTKRRHFHNDRLLLAG